MTETFAFLVSDVSRLMRRRFDERARAVGSTRAQWKALFTLSRHEGINQGGLADLLEVEPITLCRMIDRMEEAGLVERRRDPGDRRAWQIFLTAKALPVIEELRVMADDLTGQALRGIPAAKLDELSMSLSLIRDNLGDTIEVKEAVHG